MRYRENRIKCVRRFRLQQGKGQVDIQVDGHKIVSDNHRRLLLNFFVNFKAIELVLRCK